VHGDQDVNSIGDFELYVTQDDSFDDPNNIPISDFEVWARLVPMDTHGYTVIDSCYYIQYSVIFGRIQGDGSTGQDYQSKFNELYSSQGVGRCRCHDLDRMN
jgi:hypothetical protein